MFLRTILFSTLMLFCCGAALAQRPGPQFWRKLTCEPFEPRTALEAFENSYGVMIKGFTRITTVDVRGVRIDAIEMRSLGNFNVNGNNFAKGLVVILREGGERPNENRAFVDYNAIDDLLNAIDVISRVDETATKLPGFEARYRSKGDLEISVFRQTRSGTAVTMTSGICDLATVTMSLDDLAKIKAMIQEAKARLDEIR
ncbi:MAG TPA: hypothetical protein VJ751_03930 [Pyrinomonadaceae bacterium]|nr:hypothetical protein [Pyrinomonadaceae bacterium]